MRKLSAATATATATATVVGLVVGVIGLVGMPRPPRLPAATTGDAELAAAVRDAAGDTEGLRGLSVALVEPGRVRVAGLGARDTGGAPVEADTAFEIGSVGKALTGMLLADQVADGVVRPDDRLRDALPAVTGPAGEVTLAELASHRSGLPRVPMPFPTGLAKVWWANLAAADPYAGQDVDWLVRTASDTEPGDGRGEVRYSNFGAALLGQALAAKAGVSYPELLDRELLGPLGLSRTGFHLDGAALPAGHAEGSRAAGRPADAWTGSGWAPAGIGLWSTAGDLGRLVTALLAGAAPGADATTPRFTEDDRNRVGYGWFTTRHGDREVVWHNGGTGGFRAYVGVDRAAGRGVVVLGNTDRRVDAIGLRLLDVPEEDLAGTDGVGLPGWVGVGLALALSLMGGWSLATVARRGPDRLTLVGTALSAPVLLLLAYRLGEWTLAPGWVWALGCAASAAALVAAARRWPGLPLVAGVPPWRRWAGLTVEVVFVVLGLLVAF
ncbi:serine hydrolase [Micromonospora sp. WMMD882]|uniref:serine hydrolase domain-containing protein n=1 Tax=Micromonospora sp. WMMD882 TaxID=3015151 RepID=UPI00248CD5AA|nr:serine hydrolase domain-containing protein [Micromonospora sp. WMMD882]WBB77249.1 serine hydrolase [Micromonospora sp. WMMD882]